MYYNSFFIKIAGLILTLLLQEKNLYSHHINEVDMQGPSESPMTIANYGTWKSPISAEIIANGSTNILNLLIDNDTTYWCELRPTNKGRYTIVSRSSQGVTTDITPPDFNARTFVHEYGGGAFTVKDGTVYASNGSDHAIYRLVKGGLPEKVTEGQKSVATEKGSCKVGTRFADMHVTSYGLIAIAENHTLDSPVENFIALIDLKTGAIKKIASGYDFYSSPSISPDEKKIAWICWNHPNMPWTNSELWVADIGADGSLINSHQLAGQNPESIFQPQWSPEGILYFVTDRESGWWNLHRVINQQIERVFHLKAEIAEPMWIFQRSTYAFMKNKIVFTYNDSGLFYLGILDLKTNEWKKIPREGVYINQLRAGSHFVQFLESYPQREECLIQLQDLPDHPQETLIFKKPLFDEGYLSHPKHIAFPSDERTAYGFYYAPKNKDFTAQANELPPLIVTIHGGPTSQAKSSFNLKMQYWTSRGFAVLDVNYGGSTGYGREYRSLLDKTWGIVDVEDCVNGAAYLVKKGLADPEKLAIRGGSAGGYTTLAALAFKDIFKAGGNYFGVADITALADDTHKFEQRYMDQLVGKYPEEKETWVARSPINSVHQIKSPLIIFQGEDDPIVPKNQSIMIYEALKNQGIPVELHLYPGEEHGFRQKSHIIHSLERECEFYCEVFGLIEKK